MEAAGVGTPLLWIGFTLGVLLALVIDLGLFHRRSHVISMREAALSSIVWVLLALLFNAGIAYYLGHQRALEFLTGYIIELALSVDNLFVFLIIFSYFHVP
jgi:tellurite resistance protein TerC